MVLNTNSHFNKPTQPKDSTNSPNSKYPNLLDEIISPNKIGPYKLKEVIGQGAYSVVKIALDVENQSTKKNNLYACKIVPKKRLQVGRMEERFENEVRILQQLKHNGIAALYDLYKDTLNYYIILELCPKGSLFDYILMKKKIPENEAKFIFKQIIETLQYIHSKGIAHRDIKPENILIDDCLNIKFIDFGFSDFFHNNHLMHTKCGSPCYASPECVSGLPYDGMKSDIWSTGVMLYTMVNGQLPWTKTNQTQLLKQIRDAEYFVPVSLSAEIRDLLGRIMVPDADKRITINEILQHSWLHGVENRFSISNSSENIFGNIELEKVNNFFSANYIPTTKLGLKTNVATESATSMGANAEMSVLAQTSSTTLTSSGKNLIQLRSCITDGKDYACCKSLLQRTKRTPKKSKKILYRSQTQF